MDETPEELEQIRRDADKIDTNQYRRRRRLFFAVLLGAAGAGAVTLGLEMYDQRRNPCERLSNYYCGKDPASIDCKSYESIRGESVEDPTPKMRSLIKSQCQTKIRRLKEEEGVTVK